MANVLSSDGSLTGIRTLTIRVDCGTFKSEIRDGSIDHRRLEGGGGKLFEKILRRGIVIEFFSGGSRFYTKQLASTFLLSAGHSFEAACTLLDPGIDISSPLPPRLDSAPFREYGWQAAGVKTLRAVFRAVAPKVSPVLSAQHPRPHAEPDCTNEASDL